MEMVKRFTPAELCQILRISKSTLFYWERENLIPKAHRSLNLRRSRYWNEAEAKEVADYRYFRENDRRVNSGSCPLPHV